MGTSAVVGAGSLVSALGAALWAVVRLRARRGIATATQRARYEVLHTAGLAAEPLQAGLSAAAGREAFTERNPAWLVIHAQRTDTGHHLGPFLTGRVLLVHTAQVTDQVRAAPGMLSLGQMPVGGVAVTDQGAGEAGQHPAGVDVGLGAASDMEQGQLGGAGQVHVLEPAVDPGRGLIGVQHRFGVQQRGQPGGERPEPARRLGHHLVHEPDRHSSPEQIGHQRGHPAVRQELRGPGIDSGGLDVRAVLHPPGHAVGHQRDGDLTTPGTLDRDQLMLGDHRPWHGQLDHLPPLPPVLTALGQISATNRAGTPTRPMLHHLIRVHDQFQVDPDAPGCLPRRRPLLPRLPDCGRGRASPSDDGGLDEFDEFNPSRRQLGILGPQPRVVRPQLLVVRPQPFNLGPQLSHHRHKLLN